MVEEEIGVQVEAQLEKSSVSPRLELVVVLLLGFGRAATSATPRVSFCSILREKCNLLRN